VECQLNCTSYSIKPSSSSLLLKLHCCTTICATNLPQIEPVEHSGFLPWRRRSRVTTTSIACLAGLRWERYCCHGLLEVRSTGWKFSSWIMKSAGSTWRSVMPWFAGVLNLVSSPQVRTAFLIWCEGDLCVRRLWCSGQNRAT